MFFSIDVNNGVAIYEQIVRQVKFAIAEESLKPGQLAAERSRAECRTGT